MKKAIGYCRVSTENQSDNGSSLAQQSEAIEQWGARNGYEVEILVDAGLSGKRADNRPELQKALGLAAKLKCPIVCYSLSRFSRSVLDCVNLSNKLQAKGAALVSLSEQLDGTTPQGRLMFNLLCSLNQFNREVLAETVRDNMTHLRKANRRISRYIPFGYDLDGENLIPNGAEMAIVARLAELRSEGHSYQSIAATANTESLRSKTGAVWQAQTVWQVLKRRGKLSVAVS